MVNYFRGALQSWLIVGLVLALAFGVQAYQMRQGELPAEGAHLLAVLGHGQRTVAPGSFRGAEVTAVIAGAGLDLRSAAMAPGDEMIVDVLAVMGRVVIRAPGNWTVDTRAVPVAGGIRDRRFRPFDALDAPRAGADGMPAPRLVVRGAIVLGDLVIKS